MEVVLTCDRYTVPQKANENTPCRCLYSLVQLIVNMSESITDLIEISNQAELSSYLLYKKRELKDDLSLCFIESF